MALYAFDGTWNTAVTGDDVQDDSDTNVACFYQFYNNPNKWYVSGVGTRFGRFGKFLGGATGLGGRSRVLEAYKELCKNWAKGDRDIDIIGFSRGAALALDFAHCIKNRDIPELKGQCEAVQDPPIRFLGLWDVVGSFGVPINVGPLGFQGLNLGHQLTVPDIVRHCFHAMSMDERRGAMGVTRLLNGYEVWFRGVHSDVGGGNGNHPLSTIALRWMLRKAKAVGLPLDDAEVAKLDPKIDARAAIKPERDFIKDPERVFLANDRFHYTVKDGPERRSAPAECLRETPADEAKAVPVAELGIKAVVPVK